MKIKKEITPTTEEIEITPPHFRKDGGIHFFKIQSEQEWDTMMVRTANMNPSIEKVNASLAFGNESEEITEAEYLEALNKARVILGI